MFCPNCGKEISDDSVFCQYCGYKLKKDFEQEQQKKDKSKDEKSWYYSSSNEQWGPVTEEQMIALIKNGAIKRDTMVWCERFSGGWVRAENTVLAYSFQGGSSASIDNLSDKWLWALATIPLFASIVLDNVMLSASVLSTVIVVGLNILFISLDENELKNNGITAESWLWLGVILVPVYLFVRALKTTKNIIPGIVWCVMFVLSLFI